MKSKPVQLKAKSRMVIVPVSQLEKIFGTRREFHRPTRGMRNAMGYNRRQQWAQD